MAQFTYIAQNKYKEIVRGELQAQSQEEAVSFLNERGLSPIRLDLSAEEREAHPSTAKKTWALSFLNGHLTILDQITIIRHLGTILNTGTDLLGGLDIIGRDAIKPLVKRIIYDIKEKITRGEKFSDALASWKDQFNPIFLSLVKAGEASGSLPNILLSYAQELRKDYTFSRKLKGAMVYPVILILALTGMVILVLTVVTPRLKEVFKATKADTPFYTKIFFALSDWWLAYTIQISIGVLVLGFLIFVAFQNKKTQRYMSSLLSHLPVINKIEKNLVLMRLCKTMANLIDSGFPLQEALVTSGGVVNPRYRTVLLMIANQKLAKGITLSQAMSEYKGYFPGVLVSVIATGEKSGHLTQVFAQMAEFYEEEVTYSLELFLTLIEPILLFIVGIIVALMASSLISSLYNLIGKIH